MSETVTFTIGKPPTGPMLSITTGEVTTSAGEVVLQLEQGEWGLDFLGGGGFWVTPDAAARIQAALGR